MRPAAESILCLLALLAPTVAAPAQEERQAAWCGVYFRGLITDGDRKSVEPMAARVPLPEGACSSPPCGCRFNVATAGGPWKT